MTPGVRSSIRPRRAFPGWAVAVLAVLVVPWPRSAVAETIRISGTGGAIGTMQILGETFRKTNPDIRVVLLPGLDSNGSIKAVDAGRLDIGLCGRPLNGEELALDVQGVKYARTPFVFGVNRTVKITGLTLAGVTEIYAGKRDWEKGRRIRLVLRPREESDIAL
ncbi:MAG: substrate-binding domain-containing protein, partial [bacterium]|nr:substrate-binding domain-containing protein [bacterium]